MYQTARNRLIGGMNKTQVRTLVLALVLAVLAALVLLTGCSSDTDAQAKAEPTTSAPVVDTSAMPICDDLWQEGATLPADYEGCMNAEGTYEISMYYDCADGSKLAGYGDDYWAVFGDTIHKDVPDGSGYSAAFDKCKPA